MPMYNNVSNYLFVVFFPCLFNDAYVILHLFSIRNSSSSIKLILKIDSTCSIS